jgi:hypothetical protein
VQKYCQFQTLNNLRQEIQQLGGGNGGGGGSDDETPEHQLEEARAVNEAEENRIRELDASFCSFEVKSGVSNNSIQGAALSAMAVCRVAFGQILLALYLDVPLRRTWPLHSCTGISRLYRFGRR